MSTTYTPGPWYHVGGTDQRKAPFIRKVGDSVPGTMAIAQVHNRGSYSEYLANARLISAAPDLLEALQYVLDTHVFAGNDGEEANNRARAAIAKATKDNP